MQAPPGGNLVLDLKEPLSPPDGDSVELAFNSDQLSPIGIGAIDATAFGSTSVIQSRAINARGWLDGKFPNYPRSHKIERYALYIAPDGWVDSTVQSPEYVRWRRFLSPTGIPVRENIPSPSSVRLLGGYQPAPGSSINLNFSEPLAIPPGGSAVLEFGATALTSVFSVTLGSQLSIGSPTFTNPDQIKPIGFGLTAFGTPVVEGNVRYINLSVGIPSPTNQVPTPTIIKTAIAVYPSGIPAPAFGTTYTYNLKQIRSVAGFLTQLLGSPYVSGGVKTTGPAGIYTTIFGSQRVYDPMGDQTAMPLGFTTTTLGFPAVSPRYIFTIGFRSDLGTPDVHRPYIYGGFDALRWGIPSVFKRTQYLSTTGSDSFDTGYPRVKDKARKLLLTSITATTIFGDTSLRNKDAKLRVGGFDALDMSLWAILRNTRREVLPSAIAPPSVSNLLETHNNTPSVFVAGISSLFFGSADVGAFLRRVNLSGIPPVFNGFGRPLLSKTPSLNPSGISSPGFHIPDVSHDIRQIRPAGSIHQRFGESELGFSFRIINHQGNGFNQSATGSPRVEHGLRYLPLLGYNDERVGTLWISYGKRYLQPTGIARNEITPQNIGGSRPVVPAGFDATIWGTRITPEAITLRPLGFSGVFGLLSARNYKIYVRPAGITTYPEQFLHWGNASLFNSRQYVVMEPDYQNDLNPPAWPQWTAIANRNRIVGTLGEVASRVAIPSINNNARPILPSGILAPSLPEYQKTGMVTHRVRPLPLEGIEPPYFSGWSNIANAAKPLLPAGAIHSLWGRPSLEKNRRYFKQVGFESEQFSYPIISYAIRTLSFESRHTISPPRIELPIVKLWTRYLETFGINNPEVGRASLTIHFNRMWPKWTLRHYFGDPSLKNVTPEMKTRGRVSEEFGDTNVRLEWRDMQADGSNTALFGAARIADRKQRITAVGFNSLRIGDKLVVVRTGAPPESLQWITLDSPDPINMPDSGYGIPLIAEQVPKPSLQQQVVYVYEPNTQTRMGQPFVSANSIRVEPGVGEFTVGEPFVSLKIRQVDAHGLSIGIIVGRPRVTPHTIYAVLEATEQAQANHPARALHPVDSHSVFGSTYVYQPFFDRGVRASGSNTASLGIASVFNKNIKITCTGFRTQKLGWPTIPGNQDIELFSGILNEIFGVPNVKRPPYFGPLYVNVHSISGFSSGTPNTDLFNRSIFPRGDDLLLMGRSDYPGYSNEPYAWRFLRIGPLMPTIPEGFDPSLFGTSWISHWVRGVEPEGFESLVLEYDYQQFDKRMRVRRETPAPFPKRTIGAHGFRSSVLGLPGIHIGTQYIRPDGNSDQFRKGAW